MMNKPISWIIVIIFLCIAIVLNCTGLHEYDGQHDDDYKQEIILKPKNK